MDKTDSILEEISNRNYPLPTGPYQYYQEWHQVLLLHWKIDSAIILPLLPKGLELDTLAGQAWISIVPATVRKTKIRGSIFPVFSEFDTISIRTYVIKDGISGTFNFTTASRNLAILLFGRLVTGISYSRTQLDRSWHAINSADSSGNSFDVRYSIKGPLQEKSALDSWLTGRHSLYHMKKGRVYRTDIHHKDWKLKDLFLSHGHIHYTIAGVALPLAQPDALHFAKKLKVLVWKEIDVTA